MRRVELLVTAILVPLDFIMLLIAAWLAYRIRFGEPVTDIRQAVYTLPLDEYLRVAAVISLVMLVIFAWNGLYAVVGTRRIVDEFRKIFLACSTGVMVLIVLFFFNRDLFSSRFIILIGWILSVVLVAFTRFIVIQIERSLFSKGIGVHRVLLVGNHRTAITLKSAIDHSSALGLKVVEQADKVDDNLFIKLPKVIKLKKIDEIISADPTLTRLDIARLIEFCKNNHIDFKYAADIFDSQVSHISIRPIAGIPLVELRGTPLQGWGRIFKRLMDIILSALALIVFGPIMLLTALAVRINSPGSVIYKNRRVGENGKVFDTLKFRSMKQEFCITDDNPKNEEALKLEQELIQKRSIKEGPIYKIKDDPRVTTVGKIIRATSLDEFPQFINVLKGEMSLVGPRPHQPREVEKYEDYQKATLGMKPGVTGLSQISGRSDLEFFEEVRLDTYYMENWSIILDAYILFKTPFILFKKRKAV
ncbi:MAG: sugar transferase [bacterium]|nr:sugar transferase [bacterium]